MGGKERAAWRRDGVVCLEERGGSIRGRNENEDAGGTFCLYF
jgi:hypothetical protein